MPSNKFYATRTTRGYHLVKAKSRKKIYATLDNSIKQQVRELLVLNGMKRKAIRKEHVVAMFWNVSHEEVKTYINEKESVMLSAQKDMLALTDLFEGDSNMIKLRRI